ncbi:type II toxin-antitoxin system ParD family antitoxin [Sphingomonas immobilis]|uniref:Type II toxin-antitoxin system ParD family antitoxin n=1 Tax=Sphingomonas immobilis TaxID=3063997 RepID=A0ABT8ZUI1_9SPHN|nr:type II toxin-antitoxin system ParD family antitoxin [Sphingomonas sp. CA1-15]MDO7840872.1 type II toxin-antitoxin system ParD family antitoxin [Sphingomonas sp. CA1-15]
MQAAEKLSITLPAEMVRVIRAKVESGGYGSNSEVIREAMRGWMERERHFATLEAAVERGIADAEAGRVYTSEEVRGWLLEQLENDRRSAS